LEAFVDGTTPRRNTTSWRVRFLVLFGASLAGVALFAILARAREDEPDHPISPWTDTAFGDLELSALDTDFLRGPFPSESPITKIVIPEIDVDATVVTKGVDAFGSMESPDGPNEVVWYNFTALPGSGNGVFAGHVDFVDYGPAVFWHLRDLVEGDIVELQLKDGGTLHYRVAAMDTVDYATADVYSIVGPTQDEVITLITCAGNFDDESRQYDKRLIVRAERIIDDVPA
jgi:LPXTG-site transpeptidase (sortase) family protein